MAIKSITRISLYDSADFSENESCAALATIIATAPSLKDVDIRFMQSARKINVEVVYATAGINEELTDANIGAVTVTDKANKTIICSVPTTKRAA